MSFRKTQMTTILAACLACAASASGQEPPRKEVFGAIGAARWYDDEGSLGAGIHASGGFGYRLAPRFGTEGEVSFFQTKRTLGSLYPPFSANGALIMGNELLYLNKGRAQPYVLLGLGLMHFHNGMGFGGVERDRSGNGFAGNVGFGVKIFAGKRLSLRPEVRLLIGSAGDAMSEPRLAELRFSMGVGYHW